jgi:hypothetical protein
VTHPDSQADRPALRSTFSSLREWLRLLASYAWTRPPVYRVAGVFVVSYTIVTAVYVEAALWAWLLGLFVGLVGWGVILEASRLSDSDLQRYRRANGDDVGVLFDQMLSRLPLSVARRVEFLIGAFLTLGGAILILFSIATALRSAFAL